MTLAVVFGGGGVRGAFQAGVFAAIAPVLRPDFVIGSSIGAVNAWATTRLSGVALQAWWQTLAPSALWPFATQGLEDLFTRLQALPAIRSWPALAVATPLMTTTPHVVTLNQSNASEWLLASSALPGWFAPRVIDRRAYVDGGVSNVLPVAIARDLGATRVLAISAGGPGPTPGSEDALVVRPPRLRPAMVDFSAASRRYLLRAGQQAGRRLLQTPEFQAMVEIHA